MGCRYVAFVCASTAATCMLTPKQTLNLYDCQEQRPGEFERLNEELWHIKDFTAPRPGGYGENMIIEVDPDYIF